MAETNSTCLSSRTEKRQAVLDAGQRIATLMASLTEVDRDAIRACVSQVLNALEPLTPKERMCALDCATAAEQEAAQ